MNPKYKVGSILKHKFVGTKYLIVVRSLLSRSYVCEVLPPDFSSPHVYSRTELRRHWILISPEEVVMLKLEGII